MRSPSFRRLPARPPDTLLNRRGLVLGGAALALGGGYRTPAGTLARQGHSPLKDVASTAGVEALDSLLRLVPASFIDPATSNGIDWQYADFARQFASLGMHHGIDGPDFENEPVSEALYTLAHGSSVFRFWRIEDLIDAIGFQPLGMDQTIAVGNPGFRLVMFRGGFDPERLIAAWTASGYEPYDTASGIAAWTIGTEGRVDLHHPIQSKVMAEFNNVAIVDDVLIYSSFMDLLETALATVDGGEPSMADDPVYGPIARTLPETTVSAIAIAAGQLDVVTEHLSDEQLEEVEARLAEAIERTGSMPEVTGLISAIDEGATRVDVEWPPEGASEGASRDNAGTAFVRIGALNPDEAARAVDIAARRWELLTSLRTGAPYSDFAEVVTRASEDNVGVLDLVQAQHPGLWRELFMGRDVLPFAPG